SLERRSLLMFSKAHLRIVFDDLKLLRRFSAFLVDGRPDLVPLLLYHLDVRKALAAIKYTNAVVEGLRPLEGVSFSAQAPPRTANEELRAKAEESFEALANEALPAWVTSVWQRAVEVSIRRRIDGGLPSKLLDMSEGLAETFCLVDPARHDQPILFASEEFNKTTQYSNKYAIGRNCRFLQGPHTNPHAIRRIREKLQSAQQHYEPLLNYRRDGSPFMNLLMMTPLLDANGKVRYFLGAQIDTSGLLNDFYGFEYLHKYLDREGFTFIEQDGGNKNGAGGMATSFESPLGLHDAKDELQELSELFNHHELDVICKHGGRQRHPDLLEQQTSKWKRKERLTDEFDQMLGASSSTATSADSSLLGGQAQLGGQLGGVYDRYLLVRPAPYLRIVFASPSLRIPGMVQSNLMDRIGGSPQMRQQIEQAMGRGQSVTAKVKWISAPQKRVPQQQQQQANGGGGLGVGRARWIHATPLLGRDGEVGVWMVVLADEEREKERLGVPNGGGGLLSGTASGRSSMLPPPPEAMSPGMRSSNGSVQGGGGMDAVSLVSTVDLDGYKERDSAVEGLRSPPPSRGQQRVVPLFE
ncbi:hypothetical protein M406DRAFT_263032, partial [Cryphonectria parasitica EP155]